MRYLFHDKQTETEKYIAKCLVDIADDIEGKSIESLANEIGVSTSMIVKFAKNCGFSGYKEMKYYVKTTKSKSASIGTNFEKFQRAKVNDFYDYIENNNHLVTAVADKIINSKYVVFYGHGPSLSVANYFANKLSIASKKPFIVQSDEQIMDLEIEQPNLDRLVIFLSASLTTKLIIRNINQVVHTKDNYLVVYENDNFNLEFDNGIKLLDKNIEYDEKMFRDRNLYFLFFELVFNCICEKMHDS